MRAVISLFGKSPFTPLRKHMEKVSACVDKVMEIFIAQKEEKWDKIDKLSAEISKLEHLANLTKNDIRNHLPKSLFLPVDRTNLLKILSLQDYVADAAEDVGILMTLKPLPVCEKFKIEFEAYIAINQNCFHTAKKVVEELGELLETSFGGLEAESVKKLIEEVAQKENEADLIQRNILKMLYKMEQELTYTSFHLWMKVLESLGKISDLSEQLANCIRMTLETK